MALFIFNMTVFVPKDGTPGGLSLAALKAFADDAAEEAAEAPILRLKAVNCTCNNGKTGKTAKCYRDGTGEKCTSTQQGSNACYGTGLFNAGVLLCEGNFTVN